MSALAGVKLHLVDNGDEFDAYREWLRGQHANHALAFDTETTSLSPYSAGEHVRLIQIGDTRAGWAFPPMWHGAAMETLMKWDGELIAHNAKFDTGWLTHLYNWQPPWSRIHDTMTLSHLADSTRTRGLKPLSGLLIDHQAAASQQVLDKEMLKNNWNWRTIPIVREGEGSSYWIYAALDPVLTCLLFDYFQDVRKTYATAYELEMGTVRCISDMQRRGARVDLDYTRRMIGEIERYSASLRDWIREVHGVENATSNPQCIRRFKELGRQITHFTDKGADSLNKDQLQEFLTQPDAPGNDLAEQLLRLRKGEKQIGPYFRNFDKLADHNGYVHPTIWPVGTRTARMSITEPALQTLPRKDPTVRDAFIPSENNVLITIDADQIEMRLAAHFARDEGLREAFAGDDFFTVVASEIHSERVDKSDPRRQTVKNSLYGSLYGAGNAKIALTAGVPQQHIDVVMASFHNRFPGIRRLQESVERVGRERGSDDERPYIHTPSGRRMFGDRGKEYVLTNYLIQSSAAEILKQGICDLSAAGMGEFMVLPVHDELVFDVPKRDVVELKHVIETTLNAVGAEYFVPLTWGADVMEERWGQKYRKAS